MAASAKAGSKVEIPMLTRGLGLAVFTAGLSLLVFVLFALMGTKANALVNGAQANGAMFQTLFILHVPVILGVMMLLGGFGLFLRRAWAWNLVQVPSIVLAIMSIQVIITIASGAGMSKILNEYLPLILFLQVVAMSSIVLLLMRSTREAFRIKWVDILVTLLFACVLILDWLVTLYDAVATSA